VGLGRAEREALDLDFTVAYEAWKDRLEEPIPAIERPEKGGRSRRRGGLPPPATLGQSP